MLTCCDGHAATAQHPRPNASVLRRSNWLLTQDPDDDDLDIIKQARRLPHYPPTWGPSIAANAATSGPPRLQGLEFAEEAIRDLERKHSDTDWHFYSTGHSLGALMATALAIQEDQKVERYRLRCTLCPAARARACSWCRFRAWCRVRHDIGLGQHPTLAKALAGLRTVQAGRHACAQVRDV